MTLPPQMSLLSRLELLCNIVKQKITKKKEKEKKSPLPLEYRTRSKHCVGLAVKVNPLEYHPVKSPHRVILSLIRY